MSRKVTDHDALLAAAWRAKTTPGCHDDCATKTPNGLCTCGGYWAWYTARHDFKRLVTPDVIIALLSMGPRDRWRFGSLGVEEVSDE